MNNTPLPRLPDGWWKDKVTEAQMESFIHAHAAAVSAAKNAEIANLKTVMIAAAEEIQAHWDAHCDAEGYGPANLMRRLEEGIPSQYGYTAGAFEQLRADNAALRDEYAKAANMLLVQGDRIKVLEDALRAICSEQDARQGYASVETYDAARAALGDKTPMTPPSSPSPRS